MTKTVILAAAAALIAGSALAAAPAPEPWPTNAGARNVQRPQQLEFSAETIQKKKDLETFGKSRCNDCEGGFAYDTSVRLLVPGWTSDKKPFEAKVAAMAIGDRFDWKGRTAKGVFTVVGAEPVSGFPCKQVTYVLTREKASAERPGLFCYGRREYSAVDEWIEVF